MKGIRAVKKLLAAALALCLLLSCLPGACAMGDWPMPEAPSSGPCGPCASYSYADGVLTISGTGPANHLPDVENPSFRDLHTVIIEEGITALPDDTTLCFRRSITHVELPDSLRYVGRYAFVYTTWLDSLTDEFCIVGDGILLDYNGPGGKVVVPDTVRYISGQAFFDTDVTELVVGSSVKYIGDGTWGLENALKLETVAFDGKTYGRHEYGSIIHDQYTPWFTVETGVDRYGNRITQRFLVMDGVLMSTQASDVAAVPDAVHTIAAGGLYSDLLEITIPETVTKLEENAIGSTADTGTPLNLRGAPDSAVQKYVEDSAEGQFRFMPFGQENSSLLNFIARNRYVYHQFTDVPWGEWYYEAVETAFDLGLMNGKTADNSRFDPDGRIKLCEAVTVAARVRDIYCDGHADFTAAGVWYQPYVDYALKHGMLKETPDDWERPATRAEFASLLAAALPGKELEAINDGVSFADLEEAHPAFGAVMTLAKAGVMQGKGEGCFDPDAPVKRSEAAAMLSRCVRPEQRVKAENVPQPQSLPVREQPLAAGLEDYYAVREDGSLVLWGSLESGGTGEAVPFDKPVKLLDNATAVYTSGRSAILAVDRDGTLWSVNSARFDGLVPGVEQDWENAPLKPLKVMEDVSMAAMGQFHSVILKRDGSVWVHGSGAFGAPWLEKQGQYLEKVMDNAVWVDVTSYGGCAVTADHELWAWGLTSDEKEGPKKVMDGVVQTCAADMALTDAGELVSCARDEQTGAYGSPETLLTGVAWCGRSCAIREDGSLWIAGVGYGGLDAAQKYSFRKVMDSAAFAAQGENSVLVLDGDGVLFRLSPGEDGGEPVRTELGGGFFRQAANP